MPLQPVQTTEEAAANRIAQQIVTRIQTTAAEITKLRTDGVPAVEALPARSTPDGRVIPARPGTAAVTAAAINAALGAANCAILDSVRTALTPTP